MTAYGRYPLFNCAPIEGYRKEIIAEYCIIIHCLFYTRSNNALILLIELMAQTR